MSEYDNKRKPLLEHLQHLHTAMTIFRKLWKIGVRPEPALYCPRLWISGKDVKKVAEEFGWKFEKRFSVLSGCLVYSATIDGVTIMALAEPDCKVERVEVTTKSIRYRCVEE